MNIAAALLPLALFIYLLIPTAVLGVAEYFLSKTASPWPGRVLPILNSYLRHTGDRLWCEDSTDYALPVAPGDKLALVARTSSACLCKKNGVTGWYYGCVAGPACGQDWGDRTT